MCCLFGLIDCQRRLSARQKNRMLSILAAACEARGTDATGIAYNSGGKLRIYKRPVPGHQMRFRVPQDAAVIMGHTRMTTQGSPGKNFNNHPFPGHTAAGDFALAHNGVLYNDQLLRRTLGLPHTRIETDSYIGVQLIEQKKALDFASLRDMAEQVEGSFTFTVLDAQDDLFIVKGNNPMCLCALPNQGILLYASTKDILQKAVRQMQLPRKSLRQIGLDCGDILRISPDGTMTRSAFDDSGLTMGWYPNAWISTGSVGTYRGCSPFEEETDPYLEDLKTVAASFGYSADAIDRLISMGFMPEELEEFIYCGEL